MTHHLKTTHRILLSLLIVLLFNTSTLYAKPDYQREKRWADEIIPGLIIADSIYLAQKNKHQFIGLLAESDNKKLAVIVVHGMGIHPDWGFIGTMRRDIFDYGYTSLSIQMPILAANASYKAYPTLFSDAAERLQLATDYLKAQDYGKIVIVSHSNGSRMSRVYMFQNPKDITAWVALSLTQGDTFTGITAPILDLYGENDLEHVLASTELRKQSLTKNKYSTQKMIPQSNHFFAGQEELLFIEIRQFLDKINLSKN